MLSPYPWGIVVSDVEAALAGAELGLRDADGMDTEKLQTLGGLCIFANVLAFDMLDPRLPGASDVRRRADAVLARTEVLVAGRGLDAVEFMNAAVRECQRLRKEWQSVVTSTRGGAVER